MKSAKRKYFELCLSTNDAKWLVASASNPSPHMTKWHCAIALCAARKLAK